MQTMNKDLQTAMTPQDALDRLREGNQRFVNNGMVARNLLEQVEATKGGQAPFAAVLGCIDSRVSPELVFDQGVGDIFGCRVAGNIVNEDILGSIEFACKVAGSKLVVVLGHARCGAVMGACDNVELGNLTPMLAKVTPAIDATEQPSESAERNSQNADFVDAVARNNVLQSIATIREKSAILAELENEGEILIQAAYYQVASGEVEFLN
ncbi:MAG: carbonic anhydrase family protein [Pirellulales bacterium]|nr:carbonic anhydrase family protein [Pirellulales bacterium]